jgi:hypothetical protein
MNAPAASILPDPRRYFERIGAERGPIAEIEPVCLYLENAVHPPFRRGVAGIEL